MSQSDNKPETAAAKLAGEICKIILGENGDHFQVTIYGNGRFSRTEEDGGEFLRSIIVDVLVSNPLPRLPMTREQFEVTVVEAVTKYLKSHGGGGIMSGMRESFVSTFLPYLSSEPSPHQPPRRSKGGMPVCPKCKGKLGIAYPGGSWSWVFCHDCRWHGEVQKTEAEAIEAARSAGEGE